LRFIWMPTVESRGAVIRLFPAALLLTLTANTPAVSGAVPEEEIFKTNKMLEKCVNMGNALEARREGDWGLKLKSEYFAEIARAGLRSVRIPIRWSSHAALDAPYTIDPEFFERVDWAIDQALVHKLSVVINVHHYYEMDSDPNQHFPRLLGLWKQIAAHFSNRPAQVIFELLNEPHDKLSDEVWNPMIAQLLSVIRETNPERAVIVGPAPWNDLDSLENLMLPAEDRRLIITFHYYKPFHFTHQAAPWVNDSEKWKGETWRGTQAQIAALTMDFDKAAAFGRLQGRPLYLGEFGAYQEADITSRIVWTRAVTQAASRRRIATCYWEFGAGFGLYDRKANRWRAPLLRALLKDK
jgi:endoglucanase